MMLKNSTILKSTEEFPNITFDENNQAIVIDGVCMPENAVEMFEPVFEFLETLISSKSTINLNIKLSYINSMSSKQLFRILYEVIESGNEYFIEWNYSAEDELMKMKGEEIKDVLGVSNFEIKAV